MLRGRSTASATLSFMRRSWSLFTSDQANSLIRRNTKALQLINGTFFLLMRVVFVKMTRCHRKFSGGNQQNQDSSGRVEKAELLGDFFPLVRQRAEI